MGVFCGASNAVDERWMEIATELGRLIAVENLRLVYGGGRVGLMGRVADGCIGAGGEVCGVITDKLMKIEVAHGGLDSLEVTPSMSDRRNRMIEYSDMFIVLPGGVGTLDELFEVLALTDQSGECHGFARIRPCLLPEGQGWRIGPLLADTSDMAAALLYTFMRNYSGVILMLTARGDELDQVPVGQSDRG